MTQMLQIPMLMLSSDTVLKPESSAAGALEGDSGSYIGSSRSDAEDVAVFSQLLSGMVEPGKSGKASTGQRQFSAGVSILSSLSAALRYSDGVEQREDSLLANNLLQQIALAMKGEGQDELQQEVEAELSSDAARAESTQSLFSQALSDATESSKSAAKQLLKGESATSVIKPGLVNNVQQQKQWSAAEIEDSGSELKQVVEAGAQIAESAITGVNTSDKSLSAEADEISNNVRSAKPTLLTDGELAAAKATVGQASANVAQSAESAESGAIIPSASTTDSLPGAKTLNSEPLNVKQSDNGNVALSSWESLDTAIAKTDGKVDDAEESKTGQFESTSVSKSTKAGSIDQPFTLTKAKDKSESNNVDDSADTLVVNTKVEKDSSVISADAAVLRPIAQALTANAHTNTTRNTAESAGDSPQQKLQTVPQSGQSDNGAAAEGDGQQQNPAERQLSSELQNAFSRTGNDSVQTRTEQTFAGTLQHIQQTTRSTDSSRPQLKTVSEQLQQNLNLQQHDAAGQLRERVNLMVRQNIQIAEIRLDPAGLGQMQIKVDVQQEQTNVQFVVQQSQAKELIEQQLPRLREMLQQQGIVLGEGSVQQQSQQERQLAQGQQQQNGQARGQHGEAADGIPAEGVAVQVKLAAPDRLVDYYA